VWNAVIENNGAGTVEISHFYAEGFNALYKSPGYSAPGAIARHAIITNVSAKNGNNLAGEFGALVGADLDLDTDDIRYQLQLWRYCKDHEVELDLGYQCVQQIPGYHGQE